MDPTSMIRLEVHPHMTLLKAVNCLAKDLRDNGASEHQIETMVQAFYIGAAQVYVIIDRAAQIDTESFNSAMQQLYQEIDAIMTDGLMSAEAAGHA